jgi:hypothetical protein
MTMSVEQLSVLHNARAWALAVAAPPPPGSRDRSTSERGENGVRLHLDASGVCPAGIALLHDLPQSFGTGFPISSDWTARSSGSRIEFTIGYNSSAEELELEELHLRLVDGDHHQVYAGVYASDGRRVWDSCLVVWDRRAPARTNVGYAPGRCPDYLPPDGSGGSSDVESRDQDEGEEGEEEAITGAGPRPAL